MIKGFDRNGCSEISCSREKAEERVLHFYVISVATLFLGWRQRVKKKIFAAFRKAAFQIEGNC